MNTRSRLLPICENVFCFSDTCQVYIFRTGDEAVLIDFGSGDVLEALPEIGVQRVTDVLMTHHHRDQAQGLHRIASSETRLWVPYIEQDLFQSVDEHWQAREIYVNYNVRQDRFSLLESVEVDGLLEDYGVYKFGNYAFTVIPTPGHTTGSITFLVHAGQKHMAVVGDLIYGPGKVWSLAATQWTYNGVEGLPATVAALLDLKTRQVNLLLPSHGQPMDDPEAAIDLTVERIVELLRYQQKNPRLLRFIQEPYGKITEHLLTSRQNTANTFVLRSESGRALLIDFGYDFMTGSAHGNDRASRRPWLYSIPGLKRLFKIHKIDVVIPTHYHDDHVAGINILRRVEGTKSWIPENFAEILESPCHYDLPCLWYDPIPADRVLKLDQAITWEEYTLKLHSLPGHTHYAVAIEFEVDGVRVLATGDQHQDKDGLHWNYVYQNRFQSGDYGYAAELFYRIQPQVIISGHFEPLWVKPGYFDQLQERGIALERIHRDLLPEETAGFGVEGFGARIEPYQATAHPGGELTFRVEVHNPYPTPAECQVQLVTPKDWNTSIPAQTTLVPPNQPAWVEFQVTIPIDFRTRRARVGADLTVDGHKFGQQAEALITVERRKRQRFTLYQTEIKPCL